MPEAIQSTFNLSNNFMNSFKLVVFDIAGTTVKDNGSVAFAFITAFKQNQFTISEEAVNKVMGFRKKDAILMLLKEFYPGEIVNGNEIVEKIHDAFTWNMINHYENDPVIEPQPFAEQTFSQLKQKGLKVALNTGFTRVITNIVLTRLSWNKNKEIDYVISSDEVANGRPHADMIEKIMRTLDVSEKSGVVKVGDTEVDVEEGRNAGCGLVVGITTGALNRKQLEQYKPDKIIDSLSELPSLIQ